MKKSELAFSVAKVPLDYLMILCSGLFSYWLRFDINSPLVGLRPAISIIPFALYMKAVIQVGCGALVIFSFAGLYRISSTQRIGDEIRRVFYAGSTVILFVIVGIFLGREIFLSRFLIIALWVVAVTFLSLERVILRMIQSFLFHLGIGIHHVVLVGSGTRVDTLIHEMRIHTLWGWNVVDHIAAVNDAIYTRLENIHTKKWIDEVIVAEQDCSDGQLNAIIDFCSVHHRIFKFFPRDLHPQTLPREVVMIGSIPIVEVKSTPLEGWQRVVKRLFDIIVASILLIILSPVFLIVAILIKIDSKGPVFFSRLPDGSRAQRIGEHGVPFYYFKFRTMIPEAHALRYTKEMLEHNTRSDGPMVKYTHDPRVTRLGRWLRTYSIDELPELFLVLIGSMSLVGPRPHLPEEVEHYSHYHRKSLTIKPGITGLAQIQGRSNLPFDEEVRLDAYYIEHWSIVLDIWILLKTPRVVLQGSDEG